MLRRRARRGVSEAQHRLALILLDNEVDPRQLAEAEKWLRLSAESMPESVYTLALLKAEQQPDADAARRAVVEKAAAMGYAPAQFALARVLHGKGTPEDRVAAREVTGKGGGPASCRSCCRAALPLTVTSVPGIPRIVSLLTFASEAGSARADYALAQRYAQAHGVKRDTERASQLMRRSAVAGHVPSQYAVGYS